ncbi:MAG: hypothetical protein ACYDCS_13075 [Candidatus Dormibacteria bacterium]
MGFDVLETGEVDRASLVLGRQPDHEVEARGQADLVAQEGAEAP